MQDERIEGPEDAVPAPQEAAAVSEDAAAEPESPGVGETLRAAREERGVTLEQASDLLRIEPRFLAALEEERLDAIGPPVFVKGYLRHYCELLGLDPAPMLGALGKRAETLEPELKGRRPAEDEYKGVAVMPIVAAAVIVAGAIAWWQLGNLPGGVEQGTAEQGTAEQEAAEQEAAEQEAAEQEAIASGPERETLSSVAEQAKETGGHDPSGAASANPFEAGEADGPDPSAPRTAAETNESAETGGSAGASGPAPVANDVPATSGTADGTEAAGSGTGGSGTGGAAETGAAAEAESEAVAAADASPPASNAVVIELRFIEDSWTEVTSATGERLLYDRVSAGAEERIVADGEVSVVLGNADGVRVRVNGEAFAFPPGSRRGSVARFRLAPPEDR